MMHFGHHNPKHSYHLEDQILEISRSENDLGVNIDDSLKFHLHTAAATKKANQILGMIKKYRTRDATTISTLYKSMARPHLEYDNTIWGPFYQEDIGRVEAIQRKATKLVNGLNDKSYEEQLKDLKLPSLVYRRKRGDMIQMFKVVNGLVRIDPK